MTWRPARLRPWVPRTWRCGSNSSRTSSGGWPSASRAILRSSCGMNRTTSRRWADSDQVFIDTTMAMHRAIARVEGETGLDFSVGGVAVGHVDPELTRAGQPRQRTAERVTEEAAVEQGTPPDFISWHDYTRDPLDYGRDVGEVRNLIADPSTPLVITEWNHYGLKGDARNTAIGAAFNLAALIEMENAGVEPGELLSFGLVRSQGMLTPGLVDRKWARRGRAGGPCSCGARSAAAGSTCPAMIPKRACGLGRRGQATRST